MRKKDLVTIVIAVVVIVVGGALLYRYIFPPANSKGITYEAPHPVNPNFNQTQLDSLRARTDYTPNISPKASINSPISFVVENSLGNIIYRK